MVDFLEGVPPGSARSVSDAVALSMRSQVHQLALHLPDIRLHCGAADCDGERIFTAGGSEPWVYAGKVAFHYAHYVCRNCRKTAKTFALQVRAGQDVGLASVKKLGEDPPFGPPFPARVLELVGPDNELLLKGRRSENQGLGIGAFGYYRRVVENQKDRIFKAVLKVSEKLGADEDLLSEIRAARTKTQFSEAVDTIKHALPAQLLINGQNPLLLLHGALSDGLHNRTDEECLEVASDVRKILTLFAEQLDRAIKEQAEISESVSRLLKGRAQRKE